MPLSTYQVTVRGVLLSSAADVTTVRFGTMDMTIESQTTSAVIVHAPAAMNAGAYVVLVSSPTYGTMTSALPLYTVHPCT